MSETTETNETNAVAISNQKGGAGKTTTVVHLAGALNERGEDVLVVDLDKQGGLTNAFGYEDIYFDVDRATPYEILMDVSRADEINDHVLEGEEFDIVPSTEKNMAQSNISQLAESGRSRERLGIALDALEHDYDWILVDTAPDLNVLTDNAIVATGHLVVPFFPEKLNQNSLRLLLKELRGLDSLYDLGQPQELVKALVATRVETNSEHEAVAAEVRDGFDIPFFEVRKRTALSQAIEQRSTIFTFGGDSDRIRETRATFEAIADLLEDEL